MPRKCMEISTVFDVQPAYSTSLGHAFCGDSLDLIDGIADGAVDLCITSPPFALRRPKEYGNPNSSDYVLWLAAFMEKVWPKLAEKGSLVLDLGGSYEAGVPERSLCNFRVLLHLCDVLGYHLAQDFYWNNPARLPSPIEWVNKRKIRAKDSVDTVWWLSKTPWPKADVTNVLVPYSERMRKLIATGGATYTPGLRPSGHEIGTGFKKDNGGALPSNLLNIANTESNSRYLSSCKKLGIKAHPARFPAKLPEFFIRMLTDPGDLVLDIFAGSNTTGAVAEKEGRRWLSFEKKRDYVAGSILRFCGPEVSSAQASSFHSVISEGASVDLNGSLQNLCISAA